MNVGNKRNTQLLFLALLFFYLAPEYLRHLAVRAIDYSRYVCFFVTTILWIKYFVTEKISKLSIVMFLYAIWMIVDTALHGGPLLAVGKIAVNALYGFMATSYMIDADEESFFQVLESLLLVICTINTLSIVFYPSGLYTTAYTSELGYETRNWFLGFKNYTSRFYYILIIVLALSYTNNPRKINFALLCYGVLISIVSAILIDSSQFLACSLLLTTLIYLKLIYRVEVLHHPMTVFAAIVVFLFVSISITHSLLDNTQLQFVIEKILGENMTFSGRVRFWNAAMDWIRLSPFSGYGYQDKTSLHYYFPFTVNGSSAFSFYLQRTFEYGLIGMSLLVLMFTSIIRRIDLFSYNTCVRIISYGLFCMLIVCIVESFQNNTLWLYLGMSAASSRLNSNQKVKMLLAK